MKRIIMILTVALVMAAMMVAMAMPAFANKGGTPNPAGCGLGDDVAHSAQENTFEPGASESAHIQFFLCGGGN
jgi:hypothetical protein